MYFCALLRLLFYCCLLSYHECCRSFVYGNQEDMLFKSENEEDYFSGISGWRFIISVFSAKTIYLPFCSLNVFRKKFPHKIQCLTFKTLHFIIAFLSA